MNISDETDSPNQSAERSRRWFPTDPRQRVTYRRLRLFGEAPAAHFRDACRMMSGLGLEATTHLVGHSLRECDGAIRGVMSSMLSEEQRAAVDSAGRFKHKEQIEQICTLLGFTSEDEIRAEWWAFGERLHEWTHRYSLRAPRPIDGEFRTWWAQGQVVLSVIVHRFETVYGHALPRVVELAAKNAPTEADLSELRENVPHSDVAFDRFFAEATLAWFPLLREGGYLGDPPRLEPDEEGRVAYVPWPAGAYLTSVAAADDRREEVVELALRLDGTDNPAAQEAVVDIGVAVPAGLAAQLAEEVAGFLGAQFQWRLPLRAKELVVHYAVGGEIDAALIVLRAMLAPAAGSGWSMRTSLDDLIPQVFPQLGPRGIGLLTGLLEEELTSDPNTRDRDYSYLWRPTLESGRRQDRRDALVTGLRDATLRLVEGDLDELRPTVGMLEARGRSIFARLALDLLRQFPDDELIAERLSDHARFVDPNLEREWTLLAQSRFGTLPETVRAEILGWVEAGPDDGAATDEERRERWQRMQLVRLGDDLPEEWRERRDAYLERFGQPDVRRSGRAIWSGNEPPISKDELAAKTVDEIHAYLGEWRPDSGFDGPSVEGLSRLLAEVVADDAPRFAAEAETFIDVDPTYARNVFSGLVRAAWSEAQFDWPPVLAFAAAATEQPRTVEGRDEGDTIYVDRGWSGARVEIARLLSAGLEKRLIAVELADQVWELLVVLTDDPEPDIAYERQWLAGMGASGLALNTVRGSAMEALMHYVWWRKRHTTDGEEPHLDERVAEVLERHLDSAIDPTQTVRSVYGQWFPYLSAADANWARSHVDATFGDLTTDLGVAAWHSYLIHDTVYDDVAALLRPQYVEAVAKVSAGEVADDEERSRLVGHLIALYVRGFAELEDDLLGCFFAEAPVELRAKLIEAIGIDVTNAEEVSGDVLARLQALWESRFASAAAAGGEALAELRGFSWWFGAGKFDDDWLLAQLIQLFDAGGGVDFDHVILERLAVLREARLSDVVRALSALIDGSADPWFVLGARNEIREVLTAGLVADDVEVSRAAREATNRLIARGQADFGELLE
jgi:hypothetical protein